jgi:adenosylcobinamide-phosphate guanylyltransferase
MGVTAVVMAGGKGSRMAFLEEKPLVQVGGKPLIEHVIRSLQEARRVDSIVVAVSDFTPRTAVFLAQFPVRVANTPGKGYIEDMQYVVKQLGLGKVLNVAADLPLITAKVVDEILERYEKCGKPALTVVVPLETKAKLGLSLEYAFQLANETVVPAGINVVDGRRIDEEELDQEICVMDKEEVAVNINTPKELKLAEALFKKRV